MAVAQLSARFRNLRLTKSATMGGEEGPRQRLAHLMEQRRRALGLSVRAAAQAAGIDRATWTSAEAGTRQTAEYNYAGIEKALSWQSGSIDAILDGRDPTPVPVREKAPEPPSRGRRTDYISRWEEDIVAEIYASPVLTDQQKEDLAARARAKAAESRVIEDRLRRTA